MKRPNPSKKPDSSKKNALLAVQAALDKKALEPVLMDVSGETSYADYLLVVSGRSERQVQAIADGIEEALAEKQVRPLGTEGKKDWILLDFGDLIVHVFSHPTRQFYDLEGMWIDVPRVKLKVPEEARLLEPIY